jgi:hypothetical protein
MIGLPHLRRNWRQAIIAVLVRVIAAVHNYATQCEMNEIASLKVRPRTTIAERADTAIKEAFIA